jgi:hypothetical protein
MNKRNLKYTSIIEVSKCPYYCKLDDSNYYVSERICVCTVKIRKNIIKRTKWVLVYVNLTLLIFNGAISPLESIGLALPPSQIVRSIDLPKKLIISQATENVDFDFSNSEIEQLYQLLIQWQNNSLNKEELIHKVTNLPGGSLIDVVAALGIISAIAVLSLNDWGLAFQLDPIIPPHLQWLYKDQKPEKHNFGYGKAAGPRSITVSGMAQTSESNKGESSFGSCEYENIMKKIS